MNENNDKLLFDLIDIGFKTKQWNIKFSDGTQANNKLELDYDALSDHPEVLGKAVTGLCDIVKQYDPDFVVGIPSGALGYAAEVAEELDIYNLVLSKDQNKHFDIATEEGREKLKSLGRGVLIDDVYRTGSNFVEGVRAVGEDKIIAAVAIFDRGHPSWRKHITIDKPVASVVAKPILPRISRHSMLGRKW